MLTLTELRYLITLADTGHFGKAAEICHVSQPTLSISLKKLEEKLGTILIERNKHHIFPTSIGEQVISQAKLVLRQAQHIKEVATAGKDELSTPLRIGAIFTIGPYLFPALLPGLQALAPDMQLVIEESCTESLRDKLAQAYLDAIIVALPFMEPDIVTRKLYEEPFVVLIPKKHPWAEADAIHIDQLATETVLLLGKGHCFRDQLLNTCPQLKEQISRPNYPIATMANTSLDTLKHMVACGLGITVLPQSASPLYGYHAEKLCIKPFFSDNIPSRTVALAWRASYPRFKAIDIMCTAIKTYIKM